MTSDRQRSEPETFRARSLAASLTVEDLPTSLAWYREGVGFHVEETHEEDGELTAAVLLAGEVQIYLNQDDGARGRDRIKGQGFSLHLETVQDLDEIAARIRARSDLEGEPGDNPWGGRSLSVRDPDGFRLFIHQHDE